MLFVGFVQLLPALQLTLGAEPMLEAVVASVSP
jgi:hypothetical protein